MSSSTPSAQHIALRHYRTRVGSNTIAYDVAGDGPPLVLIHGLSGSSHWWARNVHAFAAHFRVYMIDLIGFGASRSAQGFVLHQAAEHVARWMDQAGILRAALVGHSMGGYIAAELAADFSERVERLVLVDAAALPLVQNFAHHAVSLVRELPYLAPDFLPTLLFDAWRAGPTTLWNAAHALLEADLRSKLEKITAPTLVVWGEHDGIVPLEMGHELSRIVRSEGLLVLKGAGHIPMWDCAQAFNQEVGAFLHGQWSAQTPQVPCIHPQHAAA